MLCTNNHTAPTPSERQTELYLIYKPPCSLSHTHTLSFSLQTFLKKITRSIHRHELSDARRMYDKSKPEMRLDHLIKEVGT